MGQFDMHARSQRDVWLLVADGGATNVTIAMLDVLARLTRLNAGYKAKLIRWSYRALRIDGGCSCDAERTM
jgi:hypothetical protein